MERYLAWGQFLLYLIVIVMLTALTGCSPNKNSKLNNDIQLVPEEHTTKMARMFRQQLVYCTTQYLALSQTSTAKVEWVLKAKKLTIKSTDSKLERYLNSCATGSFILIADANDSGKMDISSLQLSEEKRM